MLFRINLNNIIYRVRVDRTLRETVPHNIQVSQL